MLRIQNITKSFGGVKAIRGSEFMIQEHKVTALIGPNGAGKTTLFDIIGGFITPDSGQIFFKDKNITKLEPFHISNLGISRTFQQVRLFKYLTILEHLRMTENNDDTRLVYNMFKRQTAKRDAYEQLLIDFGIEHSLDTLVSELSYGQRKLLDIVLSLQKQHTLLMLDEPVAGVNSVIQEYVENLLLDLKQKGETILLIDHDMEFVRKLADHCVVLDAGVVLLEGEPSVVLKDKRVLEAYLGV